MLTIRNKQMDAFKSLFIRQFVEAALTNISDKFPDRFREMGEEAARRLVEKGIRKAEGYGITGKEDVILFIDLMMEIDPDFDAMESLDWIRDILEDDGLDGEAKMELIYDDLPDDLDEIR